MAFNLQRDTQPVALANSDRFATYVHLNWDRIHSQAKPARTNQGMRARARSVEPRSMRTRLCRNSPCLKALLDQLGIKIRNTNASAELTVLD